MKSILLDSNILSLICDIRNLVSVRKNVSSEYIVVFKYRTLDLVHSCVKYIPIFKLNMTQPYDQTSYTYVLGKENKLACCKWSDEMYT